MATPADAQAVKSLNTSGGRVYKRFDQRINEIDISGYLRSLEKVKPEPSEGSSFFRDCLVEWRELNTAEDFISFYEEMLPFVQTLPYVIEQKELIFTKHVSRLPIKARLSLFFALLIKPLNIIPEEAMYLFWSSGKSSLDYFQKSNFLKHFTGDTISTLSRNQKSGFLHVIQDILEVFDELRVRPFLDFVMGCVVRLMENSAPNIDEERNIESLILRNAAAAPSALDNKENVSSKPDQAGTALDQFKELRSLCLKIIAHVLDKYEDSDLGSEFWDLFFSTVNPLIKNFKQEGSSSEKPSSLFSCFLSMSRSCNLVSLLCREESLVPDICSILTVTTASEAIKSSALKFI